MVGKHILTTLMFVALTFSATTYYNKTIIDNIDKVHTEYVDYLNKQHQIELDSLHTKYIDAVNLATGYYFVECESTEKEINTLLNHLNTEIDKCQQ